MAKDTSGTAFPYTITYEPGSNRFDGTRLGPNEREVHHNPGMSLRDYFAGQALMGLIACEHEGWSQGVNAAARSAYDYADAMLEARKE